MQGNCESTWIEAKARRIGGEEHIYLWMPNLVPLAEKTLWLSLRCHRHT